jgi:hypothetical protein
MTTIQFEHTHGVRMFGSNCFAHLLSSGSLSRLSTMQLQITQRPAPARQCSSRRPLRVNAVLATPLPETQKQQGVEALKKAALITAVKTP